MKVSRRKFFGLSFGAAVAAPQMDVEKLLEVPSPSRVEGFNRWLEPSWQSDSVTALNQTYDWIEEYKKLKQALTAELDSRYDIHDFMRNVCRLDPDLASSRFSISAKIRMQAQRNIELEKDVRKKSILARMLEIEQKGVLK